MILQSKQHNNQFLDKCCTVKYCLAKPFLFILFNLKYLKGGEEKFLNALWSVGGGGG